MLEFIHRYLFYLTIPGLLLASCKVNFSEIRNEEKGQVILYELEKSFAEDCAVNGHHSSFLKFMHPDGVILMDNLPPLEGKSAVEKHYAQRSDSSYSIYWKPVSAKMSDDNTLGYTYGLYTIFAGSFFS